MSSSRGQGCVEAMPEHPLEATSAAAFGTTLKGVDSDSSGGEKHGGKKQIFVTQRDGSDLCSETTSFHDFFSGEPIAGRNQAEPGNDKGRQGEVGSIPTSPALSKIAHEPHAPLTGWQVLS